MTQLATLTDSVLTITAGGFASVINVSDISRSFDAVTHFPDSRARLALADVCSGLNYFAGRLDKLASEGGAVDVSAEAERFARRHVELYRRAWAMESRCMSWFIVGPANFPTARNQKRQASRDKAHEAISAHMDSALKSIERTAWPHGAPGDAIRANHPDAISLIRAKIEKRRNMHALMKAANAAIRAAKTDDKAALAEAVQGATGFKIETCLKIVSPPQGFTVGFGSYSLSGELAEIKRLEARLAMLEANAARGTIEHHFTTSSGALRIVEDPDAARVQLFFDGKPSSDVRDTLKSHGFRWAPSVGAWQRHLNNAGRSAASSVLRVLGAKREAAPAVEAQEPTESAIGQHMGRTFPTARRFDTDDEANTFMASAEGSGFGVLYVDDEGRPVVARCDDMGQRAA